MFGTRFRLMMTAVFVLFILFLYGPMISILVLSFQGPDGGFDLPDAWLFYLLV